MKVLTSGLAEVAVVGQQSLGSTRFAEAIDEDSR